MKTQDGNELRNVIVADRTGKVQNQIEAIEIVLGFIFAMGRSGESYKCCGYIENIKSLYKDLQGFAYVVHEVRFSNLELGMF